MHIIISTDQEVGLSGKNKIKFVLALIWRMFLAFVIFFYSVILAGDLLSLRYGVIAYNPLWLNFQIISFYCFVLIFGAELFVSKKVSLILIPCALIFIIGTSLRGGAIEKLPAYQINGIGYHHSVQDCLNKSIGHLGKQTACYEKKLGNSADFIKEFCRKRALIGQSTSEQAQDFRFAQCLYHHSRKGE